MVMWLYGWEPLTQALHAAIFNGFRHCGSGDDIILIYYVISKNYVFKGFYGFMGGNPSQ